MIEILTTGGTFDTLPDGSIGPPRAAEVLAAARVTLATRCYELMRLDSSVIQDVHRQHMRRVIDASDAHRFIIVHGTDTMLETAAALGQLPDKVVVLTGSFVTADRPGDAAFNLGAALLAVQLLPPGAHVVMGGECFLPARARKNTQLRRFERVPDPERMM